MQHHEDDFIFVGAKPSMGKTTFALNIAYNVGKTKNQLHFGFTYQGVDNSILSQI
ncbi:DnaB-like helicase C terminal domain-containing protein [Bacillus sp. 491mf]|uniref:DnaB-like helicase C-terminal domain-containing protein n=1 Tax=Bacillus sp. 491mf TaxID=1761755 RepID=UPI0008ED094A|nr:DnaB-like helicase C-terminal domain-containing protein [Bacillus sp. 491mf]SFC91689.1 DnaB-like helicase C terminal domain-containing protein [Bacillus sp. 491mf]